ncbi:MULTISPECIES: ATP-binding protein [Pseudofrankia]|uniref:ATP-binding protein n=1 Tax=Pseudofrankia TaxID=2994363 RepID=UPI000234CA4A|nr:MULTISPECIES: ATP-binding protein [Pseudofrankia]OHV41513.1 anti-sigma factor [Pseudofrankia sp. EUN1h]
MVHGPEWVDAAPVERFSLPASARSPGQARVRLGPVLRRLGVDDELADLVLLLTSELVTNAVLHGHGEPVVEVRATVATLWVGVEDPDSRLPRVQQVDSGALGGRGLHLVDSLARDWGAEPIAGDGKTVWFHLARSG